MGCVDFTKLKKEYLKGGTSYRKLAEKYGVSLTTLKNVAAKEGWVKLRDQTRAKTDTKIIDAISDEEAKRAKRLQSAADRLLTQLEQIIDKVAMEDMLIDRQALKQITGALKDIKAIQNIKAPLDVEEQKARIAKLKKEAQEEDKTSEIVVKIEGGEDSWQE